VVFLSSFRQIPAIASLNKVQINTDCKRYLINNSTLVYVADLSLPASRLSQRYH
jgi:hypothetical protein